MATNEITQVVKIEASLTQIQSQLKTLEGNFRASFGNISGLAQNALGALGVGLSVGGVVAFGKEILNLADTLQNLSDQTGVSVELLSGFKSPLEEAGTSVDTFARGVFNLQKNLGNIDKETDPAAQAIKRLGLNLDQLRNAAPDEFIKQVTDALGRIENPIERNTVLFNLLGKSAKELGPALSQLAGRFDELRAKGLTAAEVKALDDIGDALTRLKNQALLLGAEGVAGVLRFFGALRDAPKLGADLAAATEKAARLFNLPKERIEGMTSNEIIRQAEQPTRQADLPARRQARDELLNLREEFNKINQAAAKVPPAPFKGIATSAKSAKKEVDNLVDSFLGGLQTQLGNLQNEKIKLELGPGEGLLASLNAQFEQFKENLRAKQLPIPKGLEEFFVSLRDRIALADADLRKFKATLELIDLDQKLKLDIIDTSSPEGEAQKRIAEITIEYIKMVKKIEELGRDAQLSQEEIAARIALAWKKSLSEISEAANAEFKKLDPGFRDLQKSLAIEILPPDQQGAARAGQEFEERIRAINAWRDAAIRANQDVEQVNAQAAQATVDAWTAASGKMKEQVEDTSEFTRRAFERGFDAVADAFKDFLDNGFTSFEDFGKKILRVINSIVADQITLELKKLVLGEDFGKKGGQLGGLLGDIFGTNKKTQEPRPPAVTGEDIKDAGEGQILRDAAAAGKGTADQAAIAAIQTQVTTAQTTIQAISTEATTAIQGQSAAAETTIQTISTEATTAIQAQSTTSETGLQALATEGQAAIQTTGTTAQAGIEAVKIAALAAIEAAKSTAAVSSGAMAAGGSAGGIFGGLFGGGGGAPESAIGGAFDAFELGMWHKGGALHYGPQGPSGVKQVASAALSRMHGGGAVARDRTGRDPSLQPGEVMLVGEIGEVVISKEAVATIGKDKLLKANAERQLPRFHDGGEVRWDSSRIAAPKLDYSATGAISVDSRSSGRSATAMRGGITVNQTINAIDAPSFQRSRRAVAAQTRKLFRGLD